MKTRAIDLIPTKISHSQPPIAVMVVARKAVLKTVLRVGQHDVHFIAAPSLVS